MYVDRGLLFEAGVQLSLLRLYHPRPVPSQLEHRTGCRLKFPSEVRERPDSANCLRKDISRDRLFWKHLLIRFWLFDW